MPPAKKTPQGETSYYNELELDNDALNESEISVSSLKKMLFFMAGSFEGEAAEGLEKTVMIQSSDNAYKVKTDKQFIAKERLTGDPAQYDIAVKLNGTFNLHLRQHLRVSRLAAINMNTCPQAKINLCHFDW